VVACSTTRGTARPHLAQRADRERAGVAVLGIHAGVLLHRGQRALPAREVLRVRDVLAGSGLCQDWLRREACACHGHGGQHPLPSGRAAPVNGHSARWSDWMPRAGRSEATPRQGRHAERCSLAARRDGAGHEVWGTEFWTANERHPPARNSDALFRSEHAPVQVLAAIVAAGP